MFPPHSHIGPDYSWMGHLWGQWLFFGRCRDALGATCANSSIWMTKSGVRPLIYRAWGCHMAASSTASPPCSPWPGPPQPCRGLDNWKSGGASGRCPSYLLSLGILVLSAWMMVFFLLSIEGTVLLESFWKSQCWSQFLCIRFWWWWWWRRCRWWRTSSWWATATLGAP